MRLLALAFTIVFVWTGPEATLQVISSWFWEHYFFLRVAKIVIRCSWGKQVTEISWGEIINALVL